MSLPILIEDPKSGRFCGVSNKGYLMVAPVESTRLDININPNAPIPRTVLQEQATTSGGLTNLSVDGSVTPYEFNIEAEQNSWLFLHKITMVMVDGNIKFNAFGGGTALTNGFQLYLLQNGTPIYLVPNAKNLGELVGWSGGDFTLVQSAYANDDMIVINFVMPVGAELPIQSTGKLVCYVRDNMTHLTKFEIFAIGVRESVTAE